MEYGGSGDKAPAVGTSTTSSDSSYILKKSNIFYAGIFFLGAILCFILFNSGYKWLGKIITTNYTDNTNIGITLVARTAAALAVWFLIHCLSTIGNSNLTDSCQFIMHTSFLTVHFILFLAIWAGFLFIPDGFFDVFMKLSLYISGIYLVMQLVFLISFFMNINDYFAENDYTKLGISIMIIFSLVSVTGVGLFYHFFGGSGCDGNIAVITINLILFVAAYIIAGLSEHGGSIFTSSFVVLYVTYLTGCGLVCSNSCNTLATTTGSLWMSIVGSIFTLAWLCYSAFSATGQFKQLDCCEAEEGKPEFSLSFFHFIFFLASVYLGMSVTHWGQTSSEASWAVGRGNTARWVNLSAGWVALALYFWSLIAPKVCSDREFD